MTTWSDLTAGDWKCEVCRRGRPYDNIDVVRKPLTGLENSFPETRYNVKVCNDNPKCMATALAAASWPPPPREDEHV